MRKCENLVQADHQQIDRCLSLLLSIKTQVWVLIFDPSMNDVLVVFDSGFEIQVYILRVVLIKPFNYSPAAQGIISQVRCLRRQILPSCWRGKRSEFGAERVGLRGREGPSVEGSRAQWLTTPAWEQDCWIYTNNCCSCAVLASLSLFSPS